ncbi:hypothetical protein GOEFS_119_00090 [Gordonia effusa NBRC 100432]|uniref:Secreted protein n=1 Tax=Gordonia effusa NBRC 100432 TaxID=1077974 RepID=H0R618_9ACTN|nr:hypothetical protein [Gordonia effusa]GAB20519.1 hypothetical protein GOEFS_119_00090 [Gordonia effusa NBRC 100432]
MKRALSTGIVTTGLLTGIAAAALISAGAATAAPHHPTPRPGAVQQFGPFPTPQACATSLEITKGLYTLPPVREAKGWREGAQFSGCDHAQSGWAFSLTAPQVLPRTWQPADPAAPTPTLPR